VKKQWRHLPKYFFPIKSSNYKNMLIKTQETPVKAWDDYMGMRQ